MIFTWIIIILLGIGLLKTLIIKPSSLIIPLIIFGLIYYFLKNPSKLTRMTGKRNYNHKKNNKHYKHKSQRPRDIKFTVIDGKKNDNNDDNTRYQ